MRQGQVMKRLLKGLASRPWLMILALLSTLVQAGLVLYLPVLIGRAIDWIGTGQTQVLQDLLVQMLVLIALTIAFQWLNPWLYNQLVYGHMAELRQKVMVQLQVSPVPALDGFGLGDLVSRLTNDLEQLTDGLMMLFTQLMSGLFTIGVTLYLMAGMELVLFGLVVILTPVSLFIARFIAKQSYHRYRDQAQTRSDQAQRVEETIRQMTLLQQLDAQEFLADEFQTLNQAYSQASLGATFYSSTVNPMTRFVNALIYALLIGVGASRVVGGQFTVGELVTFLAYATQYTKPFNDISSVLSELQGAIACAERLYQILDLPSLVENATLDLAGDHVQGAVDFVDMAFSYDPAQPLIQDFNLHVPPGSMVAVVGPTGAGKSTMINLLMRYYEPSSGAIELDGQAIATYRRQSWRDQLGLVPQETWLFTGTVHDNIAFGRPEASRQEVVAAAKEAKAHHFIELLPQGYDTILSGQGGGLSQGQAQLLALARIFIKPPKVLLLDEATSSIDAYTELKVQEAFNQLMAGRTSFVIAHRLATIRSADLIIVMNHGAIVEQGTHEQLMAKRQLYYQMQEEV